MKKTILYLLITSLLFTSCNSVKKSIEKGQPYSSKINWPADYLPSDADFYVHNKIEINAKPEVVWNLLINAKQWPSWYIGMSDVAFVKSKSETLVESLSFEFSTMGQHFIGEIREFIPNQRLAWETKNEKLKAYHAWLILPTENGCLLITDEVQKGKLAKLQKVFLPNKLRKLHNVWLNEFKRISESK